MVRVPWSDREKVSGMPLRTRRSRRLNTDEMITICEYPPVVDFDTRFYYYDHYIEIADDLLDPSTGEVEEGKAAIWELKDLAMAMDPESFAAKAMQPKKRKRESDKKGTVFLRILLLNENKMDHRNFTGVTSGQCICVGSVTRSNNTRYGITV